MIGFLSAIPGKAWLALLVSAAFASVYAIGYNNGMNAAEVAAITKTVEVYRDAKKIDDKIRAMPDGAAVVNLKLHWSRD